MVSPLALLEQTIIPNLRSFGGAWHETARAGDTGVGMTLERGMDIKENNSGRPDIEPWELKANLITGNTKAITLFTRTPRGSDKLLLQDFANADGKFYADSPNLPFHLEYSADRIDLISQTGMNYGCWDIEELREKAIEKVSYLIVVRAEKQTLKGTDYYRYVDARCFHDFDCDQFISEIDKKVRLSFRTKVGKNHGTAFRVMPDDLPNFYRNMETITFDLTDRVVSYQAVQQYLDRFLGWAGRPDYL